MTACIGIAIAVYVITIASYKKYKVTLKSILKLLKLLK